tara:strand:- start:93 stop:329 length:237 start_codon:yes stop_codon:yes gene_type:complete
VRGIYSGSAGPPPTSSPLREGREAGTEAGREAEREAGGEAGGRLEREAGRGAGGEAFRVGGWRRRWEEEALSLEHFKH